MTAPARSLKELFLAALDVAPPDRAAWLERECAADAGLREHLNLMLAAHDSPQSLLDRSGASAPPSVPPPSGGVGPTINQPLTEAPGTVIGPYKLLQQIGEGGMGTVYMAEQSQPVQRKVALKVIKAGMDSGQVIARFEAERQALALMDHPNIAKVLDAGTTGEVGSRQSAVGSQERGGSSLPTAHCRVPAGGRPYFVMELVKGVPITQYCDENHLPPKARLELFTQVCQAVQHAHQKGVIHRDIKPTNVLVTQYDDKPVPKVIDFGVAKATGGRLTERTMFTGYGQIVGTIEYMSPEQARLNALDIDTRGDIYSLGVLLYELLTGTTPFDKQRLREAAFDEMLRMIREEEPPKPSTRLSTSEGRASIAANRSMEPSKLSGLVRGELDWIVMKALEKDRNRRYETANGFAMDVQRYLADEQVLACPPSAAYQLRKLVRRNRVAMMTTGLVALALVAGTVVSAWQAIRATRARHDAEVARTDEATQRAFADQRRIEADEQRQQAEDARKEAIANLQKAREAGDQFFSRISESTILDEPGLQPLRGELLETAVAYYEDLIARSANDPNVQIDVILARLRLVQIYYHIGYNDSYVSALDEASNLVETFVRKHPHAADLHVRLAGFWHGGRKLPIQRQWDASQAVRPHKRAIALWEELSDRYPNVSGFQSDLSKFYDVLGYLHENLGEEDERLRTRKRVCELREKIVRDVPGVYEHVAELAHAYVNLAHVLEATNAEESEKLYRQAVAIQKDAPDASTYQQFFALHQWRLSEFLRQQDRPTEAIVLGQEAIGIYETLAARFPHARHFRTVADRWKAAIESALRKQGKEAIAAYHKAIALDPNNVQPEKLDETVAVFREAIRLNPDKVDAHISLGIVLRDRKHDYEGAIACFNMAVDLDAKNAAHHSHLGYALRLHGKLDEAIPSYRKAIELDPKYQWPHLGLGAALMAQGKRDEAIDCYRTVIELDPKNVWAYRQLGVALQKLGNWDEAIACYRTAIELDPKYAPTHKNLGAALFRAGCWKEAIETLEKAIQLSGGQQLSFNAFLIAMAHWQLGDKEQAGKWYDRAIEWMDKNQPKNEELRRFRAEATELLELEKKTN